MNLIQTQIMADHHQKMREVEKPLKQYGDTPFTIRGSSLSHDYPDMSPMEVVRHLDEQLLRLIIGDPTDPIIVSKFIGDQQKFLNHLKIGAERLRLLTEMAAHSGDAHFSERYAVDYRKKQDLISGFTQWFRKHCGGAQ